MLDINSHTGTQIEKPKDREEKGRHTDIWMDRETEKHDFALTNFVFPFITATCKGDHPS